MWRILKWYTILEDFFLLDKVRYHEDVMTALKADWSNLKTLMSVWYRKLTSSCVSSTICQQCHGDIEGDVTSTSSQYQNVHCEQSSPENFNFKRLDNSVQLFNLIWNEETGNLAVQKCISVDRNLHICLLHSLVIPLPQWFRYLNYI